jgi:uncharacterized phage-associated protein
MTLSAHDVARELRKRLPGVGDVKVHKLLYYCQGWHLAFTGKPLFPERVEAWANGPVVADLWKDEKYDRPADPPQTLDTSALSTLSYVVARYGRFTGKQLIALTHDERPWIDASQRANAEWDNSDLTFDALKDFFLEDDCVRPSRELLESVLLDPEVFTLLEDSLKEMVRHKGIPDDFSKLVEPEA